MLPIDFSKINAETTIRLCRSQIFNEVSQLTELRKKEDEKIVIERRLSSSNKIVRMVATKAQLRQEEKKDKSCTIV